MEASVDLEEHFVEVPSVACSRRFAAQTVGVNLPELVTPFSDGLMGEAKIQPTAMTDDLDGEAMTMVTRHGGAHQWSMPDEQSDYIFRNLT